MLRNPIGRIDYRSGVNRTCVRLEKYSTMKNFLNGTRVEFGPCEDGSSIRIGVATIFTVCPDRLELYFPFCLNSIVPTVASGDYIFEAEIPCTKCRCKKCNPPECEAWHAELEGML
jgi:hypothetical protein